MIIHIWMTSGRHLTFGDGGGLVREGAVREASLALPAHGDSEDYGGHCRAPHSEESPEPKQSAEAGQLERAASPSVITAVTVVIVTIVI